MSSASAPPGPSAGRGAPSEERLEAMKEDLIKQIEKLRLQGAEANSAIGTALRRLGTVRLIVGELEQAERDLQEALRKLREVHGDRPHPDTVAALHALSVLHLKQSNMESTAKSVKEALNMQRALHGDSAEEHATTLHLKDMLAKVDSAASLRKAFFESKMSQWPKGGEPIKQQLRQMCDRDGGAWMFALPFIKLVKAIEQVAFRGTTRGDPEKVDPEMVEDMTSLLETATQATGATAETVLGNFTADYEFDKEAAPAAEPQTAEPPPPVESHVVQGVVQDYFGILHLSDSFFVTPMEVEGHPYPQEHLQELPGPMETAIQVSDAQGAQDANPLSRLLQQA